MRSSTELSFVFVYRNRLINDRLFRFLVSDHFWHLIVGFTARALPEALLSDLLGSGDGYRREGDKERDKRSIRNGLQTVGLIEKGIDRDVMRV